MPKKRTLMPFYGKKSQRLDATARKFMQYGDRETANKFFEESMALVQKRGAKRYGLDYRPNVPKHQVIRMNKRGN